MKPDPTIPVSLDYLVELSDDGTSRNQAGAEVIVIPPATDRTVAPRQRRASQKSAAGPKQTTKKKGGKAKEG